MLSPSPTDRDFLLEAWVVLLRIQPDEEISLQEASEPCNEGQASSTNQSIAPAEISLQRAFDPHDGQASSSISATSDPQEGHRLFLIRQKTTCKKS